MLNSHKFIRYKHMRHKYLQVCLGIYAVLSFCALSAAQAPLDWSLGGDTELLGTRQEKLFSTSAGEVFYEMAYELANTHDVEGRQIEQALTFLTATVQLDSRAKHALPDMIRLASRHPERDYSELIVQLLYSYVDESVDLEVVREALSYLYHRRNSREQRETLLAEMLRNLGGKNSVLDSELATELGFLMAEKADDANALQFFWAAYENNKYNKLAFVKLVELVGDQIEPAMYLEHLRLASGENPLDMEAALAVAQYAEKLQLYEIAADGYEYCADLFRFLYPSQALPASLYIPWAISSYNTQRSQHKCLQIALEVRQSGRFDLVLEAIAGKAAAKIGNTEQADSILQAAGDRALRFAVDSPLLPDQRLRTTNYEQLGWFYCFAAPDVNKAIEWANRAYSTEPNSPTAAAILAYSLVMNGQTDWAKLLIDNYKRNQIADLTLAKIQLARGQRDLGIESLKSAIARDPGSLAAERAKEILAQQGGEYVPFVDPDVVLAVLKNRFGKAIVSPFVGPEQIVSVQLKLRGSKFSYGIKFGEAVVITNNSTEPLVISEDGLFKGNIRIDARVSGDIDRDIPNLASVKVRPASAVEPGESISIPIRLVTGELRQILLGFPQASLDVEFAVFIDPVISAERRITSRFGMGPAKVVVKRPGVELSRKYLQNRLDSLSKGRQGQKTKSAQLVTGLLMELGQMTNREPLYKLTYADWMPDLLKSAVIHSLADDDWVVKVHTMSGMPSLPLDFELVDAVSQNLNDPHWPCRLMTIFLLAKAPSSNFTEVLDWTAQYDSNKLVRQMAVALGGKEPEQEQGQPGPATPESTSSGLF